MEIRNFLRESFIDYPGKTVSAVVFTPGCNYRCPACHAKHLLEDGENISEKVFFDYLDSRKGWIEGVVICGGEPTLQMDLKFFAEKLKERGLQVKLDTNGSQFLVLEELKQKNLIDYVAMDVKSPKYLYPTITGKEYTNNFKNIERNIIVTSQFPDYEFRTTVVPIDRGNGSIDFMKTKEAIDIAKWIVERTGKNEHKYFLQTFVPRKGELVDSEFEEFPETPKELLEEMQKEVKECLPNCYIR